MDIFKSGDVVYSKEYGKVCRVKVVAREKCSIEFDEPVLGSKVKITQLSALVPVSDVKAVGNNNRR